MMNSLSDPAIGSKVSIDQIRICTQVTLHAIELAIENGELKPFAPHAVAHTILGNVHGYLRYNCMRQIGVNEPDEHEAPSAVEAARFISEMLLDGLASRKSDAHPHLEVTTETSQELS